MHDIASNRTARCVQMAVAALLSLALSWQGTAAEPQENDLGKPIDCSIVAAGKPVDQAQIHVIFSIPPATADAGETDFVEPVVIEETVYTSNSDGRYEIVPPDLELPDVSVSIEISHPQHLTRTLRSVSLDELRRFPRSMHRRTSLKQAHLVTGRVLLPDGTAGSQAVVTAASRYRAYSWKYHDPNEYSATTTVVADQAGRFTVATDHDSTFIIRKKGFATLLVDRFDATQTLPVTFRLPDGHRIAGRVLDDHNEGVPHVIVQATRKFVFSETDMPLAYSEVTVTDEAGAYQLPLLPADDYVIRVTGRFKNAATGKGWLQSMPGSSMSEKTNPNSATIAKRPATVKPDPLPMRAIYVDREITLQDADAVVDHHPHENVMIGMRFQWPHGRDESERVTVGISGRFMEREWRGSFVDVTDNHSIKLLAPRGLADARLLTGMAKFRRTADSPVELGAAIPLGTLESSRQDIVVIKPATAKLMAELIPGGKEPANISFRLAYVRDGFHDRASTRRRLNIYGKTTNRTKFEATALAEEPIMFELVSNGQTIYRRRLTLRPDEIRRLQIDLSKETPLHANAAKQ